MDDDATRVPARRRARRARPRPGRAPLERPRAPRRARTGAAADRVVVVVSLIGGNDGLNTVVPLRQYDRYRELRPTLGWPREQLIPLPDYREVFGLNPGMQPLADLFAAAQGGDHQRRRHPADGAGPVRPRGEPAELPDRRDLRHGAAGAADRMAGALPRQRRPRRAAGGDRLPHRRRCCSPASRHSRLSLYTLSGFGVYPSGDDVDARYRAYDRLQHRPADARRAGAQPGAAPAGPGARRYPAEHLGRVSCRGRRDLSPHLSRRVAAATAPR